MSAVRPMYVSVFPSLSTVAWYATLVVRHFPLSGHLDCVLQLQSFSVDCVVFSSADLL